MMRGASCWLDYYLVRAKLHFDLWKYVPKQFARRRWLAVHHLTFEDLQVEYQEVLAEKLTDGGVTNESCWSTLKLSMLYAAE